MAKKALDGDMQAIKEIGDRLDGRPAQPIVGVDGGPVEACSTHYGLGRNCYF